MKKEIEEILIKLRELKNIKLAQKYLEMILNCEDVDLDKLENINIYNNVKSICDHGITDDFKEAETKKEEECKKEISKKLEDMQIQFGNDFVYDSIRRIENDELLKVENDLTVLNKHVAQKVLRGLHDCSSYREMHAFEEAVTEHPLRTRFFGVKIEKLQIEEVKPIKKKNRLKVEKVKIEDVSVKPEETKQEEERTND